MLAPVTTKVCPNQAFAQPRIATYYDPMVSNVRPLDSADPPQGYEVLDYTLFCFGLIRGDIIDVGPGPSLPKFVGTGVWEQDGCWRVGIPQFETKKLLTRLAGLFMAGRVEFSVPPNERGQLHFLGNVVGTTRLLGKNADDES